MGIEISMTSGRDQLKNGIDSLLAILHCDDDIKFIGEYLAYYSKHRVMIISEHYSNLGHDSSFGASSTKLRTLTMMTALDPRRIRRTTLASQGRLQP